MNIKHNANLYIRHMGRYYIVHAIATSEDEANADMVKDGRLSVIHSDSESGMVYMVAKNDPGRETLD